MLQASERQTGLGEKVAEEGGRGNLVGAPPDVADPGSRTGLGSRAKYQ